MVTGGEGMMVGRDEPPPLNSGFRLARILFWLKAVQMGRGFLRDWTSTVGTLLALVIIGPMSVLVGLGIYVALASTGPEVRLNILRAVLTGIYVMWIFLPLLGQMLTESYDLERLIHFPVTARTLFQAVLLGTLLDFWVWFLAPVLIAIVVAFSHGFLHSLGVAGVLVLFVFHLVALSQVIMYFTAGLARSRRLRETLWIVFSLSGLFIYLGTQMVPRWLIKSGAGPGDLLRSRFWELVSLVPPGYAAQTIARWEESAYFGALLWLIPLVAATYGTLRLAGWVIEQVFLGEGGGRVRAGAPEAVAKAGGAVTPQEVAREANVSRGTGAEAAIAARASTEGTLPGSAEMEGSAPAESRLFPFPRLTQGARAVYAKEIRYFVREPFFKMAFINELLFPFFFGAYFAIMARGDNALTGFAKPWLVWLPVISALMQANLATNMFGSDGHASATLFQFPVPRRDILIGKNLALMTAFSLINVFLVVTVILITGEAIAGMLVLLLTLGVSLIVLAVGNVTSILLPYRVALKGWRIQRQSAGRGCAFGFFRTVAMLGTQLLLLPPAAALVLSYYWLGKIWLIVTVPFAVAYVAGLYFASLSLARYLLESREQSLVAALTSEF